MNNAETLRYINVCIWSTYECTLYCAFKACISCIFTTDSRILIRILALGFESGFESIANLSGFGF